MTDAPPADRFTMVPMPAAAARRALALLVIAGIGLWVRLPALHQPLDRDMAAYATIGQNLWRGLIPYRDLLDHKQPLTYGFYAVVHGLAGNSTSGVRVLAFSVAITAAVAFYLLLERPFGRLRAFTASALFAVLGASRYFEGTDLNTEHLLVLFAILAVGIPLRYATSDQRHAFLAGAAGSLMVAAKVVGVFVLPAAVLPYLVACRHDWRELRSAALQYAAGFATPLVLILAWFWLNGALPSFVFANWTYNRAYVALGSTSADYFSLAQTAQPAALVAGSALVVGILGLVTNRERRIITWVGLTWLVGSIAGAKLGLRDFPHYYVPALAPAALLLALLVPPALPRPGLPRVEAAARVLLIVVLLVPTAKDLSTMRTLNGAEIARRTYGDQARVWALYEPLGAWLADDAAGLQPPPSLYVAGREAGFYWASALRPASRLLYDPPLSLFPALETELRQEFCLRPPRYVVLPYGDEPPPYLGDFVAGDYEVARQVDSVTVLRRSRAQGPGQC